ncbi:hypothetical protein HMI54_015612 [Coelomomyces lativittatus]|nr:hypothetical protein HMI56_004290 [Coelomomyces lativittatus]KAJ1501644.1 hypothetical protein HMI55_003283 [Coelomomyces lativittatus]KAJ1512617.1 hypothetical protein HMI54_015612 [Coelomomyces lativittatus]
MTQYIATTKTKKPIPHLSRPPLKKNDNLQSSVTALKKLSTSELLKKQTLLTDLYNSIQSKKLTVPDNGERVLQTLKNIHELIEQRQKEMESMEKKLETLSLDSSIDMPSEIKEKEAPMNKYSLKRPHVKLLALSDIKEMKTLLNEDEKLKEKEVKETVALLTSETLRFQKNVMDFYVFQNIMH